MAGLDLDSLPAKNSFRHLDHFRRVTLRCARNDAELGEDVFSKEVRRKKKLGFDTSWRACRNCA
jgi:hypothetical protein